MDGEQASFTGLTSGSILCMVIAVVKDSSRGGFRMHYLVREPEKKACDLDAITKSCILTFL